MSRARSDWPATLDAVAPLEGRHVRLEPLASTHHGALCEVGLDEALWRWTISQVRSPAEMAEYIADALRQREAGTGYPFAIVERSTGRTVGSTRYGNMEPTHRRVEIGWTWVGRPWQRTAVNTEAKYLLLRTAFERLDCIRVEFKTDARNDRSRAALLRIGAREEGTLRSHFITSGGRIRDSVYFSILDREWPEVRASLEHRLAAAPAGG